MHTRFLHSWALLLALALAPLSPALATQAEADVSLDFATPSPYIGIVTPVNGDSYDGSDYLTVTVRGGNVALIALELRLPNQTLAFEAEGDTLTHIFIFPEPQTQPATLVARGYANAEKTENTPVAEQTVTLLSPREELIEKMIALAYANSRDSRYKFAPAESDTDIGVCKNFVMRLFDTYSARYRMLAYPDLPLHMPKNNSKVNCAPYDYGIEWRPETAEDGSPFEIAAQFKYDNDLTEKENANLARNLLLQIKKGDFLQIVGYYGGGNGPHSLYVIRDYDPATRLIHWTDSNMAGHTYRRRALGLFAIQCGAGRRLVGGSV